jgi:hypothetical protein
LPNWVTTPLSLSRVDQLPDLVDRMSQRFFAEDMLLAFHRLHADHGVRVVRRGDHDGIDLLVHRVEHLAEIAEPFGVGERFERLGRPLVVDVAQRHDVLVAEVAGCRPSPARRRRPRRY